MTALRYIKNPRTGLKVENKTRSVNITLDQFEFLEENRLNLSLIVRERIDELRGVRKMKIDETKIEFELLCHEEETEVCGNVMVSGDKTVDHEAEQRVLKQLESGNQWSWCCVEVRAFLPGMPDVYGVDFLGCCSYSSEEEFKNDAYFSDMKNTAKEDLLTKLASIQKSIDAVLEK